MAEQSFRRGWPAFCESGSRSCKAIMGCESQGLWFICSGQLVLWTLHSLLSVCVLPSVLLFTTCCLETLMLLDDAYLEESFNVGFFFSLGSLVRLVWLACKEVRIDNKPAEGAVWFFIFSPSSVLGASQNHGWVFLLLQNWIQKLSMPAGAHTGPMPTVWRRAVWVFVFPLLRDFSILRTVICSCLAAYRKAAGASSGVVKRSGFWRGSIFLMATFCSQNMFRLPYWIFGFLNETSGCMDCRLLFENSPDFRLEEFVKDHFQHFLKIEERHKRIAQTAAGRYLDDKGRRFPTFWRTCGCQGTWLPNYGCTILL